MSCRFLNSPKHAFNFKLEREADLNKMKVTRIYTGDDNRSHFEDIEIDIAPSKSGLISEIFPATGVIFRETGGDYDYDFHTAPRRQYVINLDAAVEITVGSGEKRILEWRFYCLLFVTQCVCLTDSVIQRAGAGQSLICQVVKRVSIRATTKPLPDF